MTNSNSVKTLSGAAPQPVQASGSNGDARQRNRDGLMLGLLAATIWGCYIAMTNHGMRLGLTAADLAFIRYSTSGLLLLPWLLGHSPATLARIGWRKGAVLAILAGPPFVLVGASGFLFAPLAHSAVIQLGSVALVGVILSASMLGERVTRRGIAGLVTVVLGLAIIAGPGLLEGGSSVWKGDLLFLGAGSMWALFTVLQRRWRINPIAATAVVSVLSGLVYAPLYFMWIGAGAILSKGWAVLATQVLVLGVLSGVVALFAFSRAVEYLGPGRASVFPALAPAIAILAGLPIAGVAPTPLQIAGLAVLTIGMFFAVRSPDAECLWLPRSASR